MAPRPEGVENFALDGTVPEGGYQLFGQGVFEIGFELREVGAVWLALSVESCQFEGFVAAMLVFELLDGRDGVVGGGLLLNDEGEDKGCQEDKGDGGFDDVGDEVDQWAGLLS
jgi:hypothetical protein